MGKYDDIILLPHPISKTHPPMPLSERAAQFSSFAALSGYEEAVEESARLTESRRELCCDAIENLDEQLRSIELEIDSHPEVELCYFIPDTKKAGGRYTTIQGQVKKIDPYNAEIVLLEGSRIPLADIISIELV